VAAPVEPEPEEDEDEGDDFMPSARNPLLALGRRSYVTTKEL